MYSRSLIAKFRTGIMQLRIETGRYTNLKIEERICLICNANEVEDEIHFLCHCNKYKELRKSLFNKTKNCSPNFESLTVQEQFIFLMKNYSYEVVLYIKKAWEMRTNILFN